MTRLFTIEDCGKILDVFKAHGHNEIDTARVCGEGSCEEYLGKLDYEKQGFIMDTKLYPSARGKLKLDKSNVRTYSHSAQDVRDGMMASLNALKAKKVDMFYLHAPDRETDFEETLGEVNKLHQEGYFNRFGISNFMSWEVAQVCEICRKHG